MTVGSELGGAAPVGASEGRAGEAPPSTPLTPASASERVEIIDIVRGVALFGILAANMRAFTASPEVFFFPGLVWASMPDRVAQAFVETFVQGKFITIFAVLFGVGFAAQLARAEVRGTTLGWTYARRLSYLCLFGLVHGLLIWWGDVLLLYGLVGFLLFFFRKRKDLTLTIWGMFGYFSILIIMGTILAVTTAMGTTIPERPPTPAAEIQAQMAVFADGSWSEIQQLRTVHTIGQNWAMFPFGFLNILGLFLFGMLAWRRGFFRPAPESLPRYRRAMIWCFAVGATASLTVSLVHWFHPALPFPPTLPTVALFAVQTVATPALSLAYVSGIVLLCQNERWMRRLRWFGAVGRTALTNYLLQSVVGTLLFYSYGLGLYGRLGPALLLIPTILIFAAQVWMSAFWLERFRFGPAEWLWRSLTYRKLQPFVRDDRAPLVTAAA